MFYENPIQLVNVEDKTLVLQDDAMEILKQFDKTGKKTHVISIFGEARTGKSALLNFILSHLGVKITEKSRFISKVSASTVTLGISIWGTPISLPNGDQLLLIDAQGHGLGDNSINTQIVSILCVISSLVILNINGSIDDDAKTLLSVVNMFISKIDFGGTVSTSSNSFFPTLFIRSRDFRKKDFETDFPKEITNLSWTNPTFLDALDKKLDRDLSELSDPIMQRVQLQICKSFSNRHWAFTYPPTRADDEVLDSKFVDQDMKSPFFTSMHSVVKRIISLSTPKRISSTRISMSVLLSFFQKFIDTIKSDEAKFHVPSIIELLHFEQIHNICDRAVKIYELHWTTYHKFMETEEELNRFHEEARNLSLTFYNDEITRAEFDKKSFQNIQGKEKLEIIVLAIFLIHQNKFKSYIFGKIEEFKLLRVADLVKQDEIRQSITNLDNQIKTISTSITNYEQSLKKSERLLEDAKVGRERSESEFRNLMNDLQRSKNKGGSCIIS